MHSHIPAENVRPFFGFHAVETLRDSWHRTKNRRVTVRFLLLSLALALAHPCQAVSIGFESTGSLASARSGATATSLPNGKVLVVGGYSDFAQNGLLSAELYDPASGTWTATGSLATGRSGHTATLLPNGKVLVVGGRN